MSAARLATSSRLSTLLCICVCAVSCLGAPGKRFEVAAWVDHFDFAGIKHDGKPLFDGERPEGLAAILDHVQETGATTILWRNCGGGTMRYRSRIESHHHDRVPDKRRIPDTRAVHGWVQYGEASPDLIATVMRMCRERGLRPGVHWPFEENHWGGWTVGGFNLEHPQYWCRSVDGTPYWGRASISFPAVVQHKLDLTDELIERGVDVLFIDTWRMGNWGLGDEYVEPMIARFRERYGEPPPRDPTDPRWVETACEFSLRFFRRLREHTRKRAPDFRIMVGIPYAAPLGDKHKTRSGIDWQRLVTEGLMDTLVVNSVMWDTDRPEGSTRELYKEVLAFVNRRCRVLFPVSAYNFASNAYGLGSYEKAMGRPQQEAARDLVTWAWDAGGHGVSLECVDYNNYRKATRDVMKRLTDTTCRFTREAVAP